MVLSDLKPENILLDYTGHIALCDFGRSQGYLVWREADKMTIRPLQTQHV